MKACTDCCFSNGGHLFAAASNNSIAVYNTYTCELTGSLRYASCSVLSATYSTQSSVHSGSRTQECRVSVSHILMIFLFLPVS